MNNYGWDNVPIENSDAYIEACKNLVSSEEKFSNFRRDPDYGKILSGDPKDVGNIAIRAISSLNGMNDMVSIVERARESDCVGNPYLYEYEGVGLINPSTLKYCNTSLQIKKKLLKDYHPKTILEVGGGYGGLSRIFSLFYDYERYTIVDLPDATILAKKFLNHFDVKDKVDYITCEDLKEYSEDIDLFISDSCIAECGKNTQEAYFKLYLQKSKFAFFTWNTLHLEKGREEFYNFINLCRFAGFKGRIELNIERIAHIFLERQ